MGFIRAILICCLLLPQAAQTKPQGDLEGLLERLEKIRAAEGVAGLGLTLVNSEKTLWSGGLGVVNWDTAQPMSADTLVRIGSITKTITALAFMALERDGKLSLDTRIATLTRNPPYTNPWATSNPVTLAQLLEQSAGLGSMSKTEWDHNIPLSLADALNVDPGSRLLRWPPGLHTYYSNTSPGVAAWAMQVATGLDFEDYTHAAVFGPLGMRSATFRQTATVKTNLATGYDSDGRSIIPYWHTLYRPFGGINVTVRQMGALVRVLLAKGRLGERQIFPPELVSRMENPATTLAARDGVKFGYGLGNHHWVHGGFVFHGHTGDADGYLCRFGYNRDAGLGYFVVINAFKSATIRRMKNEIEDFIVAGLTPSFQAGVPQPRSELESLSGHYTAVTGRLPAALEISFDQGRLYMLRNGDRQHLIPLSKSHFRRSFEPVATTAFMLGTDERLYLQGPFGNFVRSDNDQGQNGE